MSNVDRTGRRENDGLLKEHILADEAIQRQILLKLTAIEAHQADLLGMIKIYRNTRGFLTTAKFIAIATVGVSAFSVALAGIIYAVKQWLRS